MHPFVSVTQSYHVNIDLWGFPWSVAEILLDRINEELYTSITEHANPAYHGWARMFGLEFETNVHSHAAIIRREAMNIMYRANDWKQFLGC